MSDGPSDEQERQQGILEAFYDAFDASNWAAAAEMEKAVVEVALIFEKSGNATLVQCGAGAYGMLDEVFTHLGSIRPEYRNR